MKSICFILLGILLLQGSAHAQIGIYDLHRITINLTSHYNLQKDHAGVSGYGKWFFPSNHPTGNGFFASFKGTHTPPTNGGPFHSMFDQGQWDNITAVYLLGGYVFNLATFDKYPGANMRRRFTHVFLEVNGGASYVGHYRDYGPSWGTAIGISFSTGFEVTMGYQGVYSPTHPNLNVVELGVGYGFVLP